jgi:type IV fimbrial biogenesis protein FimT
MSYRIRSNLRAFTLIEMLIAIVIGGIILTLAAPSFQQFILRQRLISVNSQLVTDLQFARSEAASRGTLGRVSFNENPSMTCYTLYTSPSNSTRCDCLLASACGAAAGTFEIRTVRIPRDSKVVVVPAQDLYEFAFSPITGGLFTIPTDDEASELAAFNIDASVSGVSSLALQTRLIQSGRPRVCAPSGSSMPAAAC